MSDIDTAAADSLKVLDPKRPIREADIANIDQLADDSIERWRLDLDLPGYMERWSTLLDRSFD